MTTHRRLGMGWQESVASVAVQAAKAQKRSETASTGAVSRRRYEAEKPNLTIYATTDYTDESDATTLESAQTYADEGDVTTLESAQTYVIETVTTAVADAIDLSDYCTTAAMQEYVQEYVDGIAEGSY